MTAFALVGARVFDGTSFHDNQAVVVDGRHVVSLVPENAIAPAIRRIELKGGLLAPGFVDVQVNGGGGALMNSAPTIEVVRRIADAHRKFGTVGLLPTVITDAPHITAAAIAAVRAARAAGVPGVLGIHIEGPFLDPARKGAHDAQFIRMPTAADIDMLAEADCGSVMLTLAPGIVSASLIRQFVGRGIHVSLGHAEATFAEVRVALDAGATGFTHLFNAMSQMNGREPGMVGAALADTASFLGIIADGHHVHDAALRVALASTSANRFMLVSDAMPPAAGGPPDFMLQGRAVTRVNGRLELEDGTLAGSNLTMDEALRYCVNTLGVALPTALQMASRNPARFLGLHAELGCITPGALASLVHLDDKLAVQRTWIEGQ